MPRKSPRRRFDNLADFLQCRLPDAEIMELTGASRTTVMRWRTGKSPVPPHVLLLCRLRYYGEAADLWGNAWRDFRFGRDGRLYLPGFKYGFTAADLAQWYRLIHHRHALEARLKILERDLAQAQAAQEDAERRADFYRRQLRLESNMGMMLAKLAA